MTENRQGRVGAASATNLALPDPQTVTVARVGDVVAQAVAIRDACRISGDIETARELKRRLDAFERYVTDKKSKTSFARESRLTEVLIGQLLGPAENRGPATFHGVKGSDVHPALRHDFRRMAQHQGLVEELVASGTVKRATILRAIDRANTPTYTNPEPLTGGPYAVLYADPPWRYDFAESSTRTIENQYETMDLDAIKELLADVDVAEDAVLFLWATNPKLREALEVMTAWGFDYRTNLVWVKDRIGMGYYARQRHELLLVGRRGNLRVPAEEDRPDSVIEAPRGQHSAKPEVVYELIERMYPRLPRAELFSRTRRPGWDSWGNEVAA